MFSVVIPAHNEASVIDRCLTALFAEPADDEMEVVVVCNGCKDDTASRAATYPGVNVIDISQASKVAALNAGDKAVTSFPRAYLDADVQVSGRALQSVCQLLNRSAENTVASEEAIKVSAPHLDVDTRRASWAVRAFYRVWMQLPYFSKGEMVGSGLFVLSKEGRSRFCEFPNIISDDGFVRSLFKTGERKMDTESRFTIFSPLNLNGLVKIKTRARFGNMEVAAKYPDMQIGGENRSGDLLSLFASKPWLLPHIFVYVYVQALTKYKAKQRMRIADYSTWERDQSSRTQS